MLVLSVLAAVVALAAPKPVYVVPFSHLDIYYHGPYENSLARTERLFSAALDLVEKDPDYRYTIENASRLRHYLLMRPEYRERIRAALAKGRLDCSAQWADIIQNAATSEDLVRNVLLAAELGRREFGFKPRGVIGADMPGFTAQAAQIWARSGITGALRTRGGPIATPFFDWIAPDGSAVRIGYVEQGYASGYVAGLGDSIEAAEGTKARDTVQSATGKRNTYKAGVREFMQKYYPDAGPGLLVAGGDNIFPLPALPGVLREWNKRHGDEIRLRIATVPELMAAITSIDVPKLKGDMQSTWMPGATGVERHATVARTSHRIQVAEKVATLASLLTPMPYPASQLDEAWSMQLLSLDHEGGGIPDYPQRAQQIAADIQYRAAQMIASRIRSGNRQAMVVAVINPLGWERHALVRVPLYLHGDIPTDARAWDHIIVRDDAGRILPARLRPTPPHAVVKTAELSFAIDLPPLGYRAVVLEPGGERPVSGEAPWEKPEWKVTPASSETSAAAGEWKAAYEPGTRSVALSRSGTALVRVDMAALPAAGIVETLESDQSSKQPAVEWKTVRRMERWGESVIRLQGMARGAAIWLECRVRDAGAPEVSSGATWSGGAPRALVQRVLPAKWSRETVRYGVPFGELPYNSAVPGVTPTLPRDERPPALWKNLKEFDGWATWETAGGRMAIATEARGAYFSNSAITFVLSPGRTRAEVKPGVTVEMRHRFDFYANGSAAHPERLMWELLEEPVTAVAEDRFGDTPLAPRFSLCSWSAPELLITGLRRDAQGRIVLRAYAHGDQPVKARLTAAMPLNGLEEVSPVEERIKAATAERTFTPWQIQTLRWNGAPIVLR